VAVVFSGRGKSQFAMRWYKVLGTNGFDRVTWGVGLSNGKSDQITEDATEASRKTQECKTSRARVVHGEVVHQQNQDEDSGTGVISDIAALGRRQDVPNHEIEEEAKGDQSECCDLFHFGNGLVVSVVWL